MNKPKLTDWFPENVKPVHVGWYERIWSVFPRSQEFYSNDYWDGEAWWLGCDGDVKFRLGDMDRKWRGLAKKP